MKRLLVGGILAAAFVVLSTPPASRLVAQAQPAGPQWLQVVVVQVKPDMIADWQALQQNETIPALRKIGVPQRDAWQTVFGAGFEVAFVTPIGKFAARDNPEGPMVRALGAAAAANYNARVRRMIASQRTYAIQTLPDGSLMPAASYTPKLAILTLSTIAPGRGTDYEHHVRTELLPVMRKVQTPGFFLSRTIFGGNGTEYGTMRYIENFAEIDQPPPAVRVLGQDGAAKLAAKTQGIVTAVERLILRYNAGLSFRAKTTS